MNRLIILSIIFLLSSSAVNAEDVKVIIPTTKSTNYALYPASTGVFLRLDTRNGRIESIVPSAPKKNRVLNSKPLTLDDKPGRFELYPTNLSWEWLLFDTQTGDIWILRWSAKNDILSKIPLHE